MYNCWIGEDVCINICGVGVVIFLLFIVLVGWIVKGLIGCLLISYVENLVLCMLVVCLIYLGVKQIVEIVFVQLDCSFEEVCFIEYFCKGIWVIGFVLILVKGEINKCVVGEDDQFLFVFVLIMLNLILGFLLFFFEKDVIKLDMLVEDVVKFVILVGFVYFNGVDLIQLLLDQL